jgi:hypothetical protein
MVRQCVGCLTSSFFTWVAEGAQAIEAMTPSLGMTLLRWQNEVLLLAPTYIPACMLQYRVVAEGQQHNVDIACFKRLHSINLQLNVMKDLNCDSTAVFGRLHVVNALRGFHQFVPVQCVLELVSTLYTVWNTCLSADTQVLESVTLPTIADCKVGAWLVMHL